MKKDHIDTTLIDLGLDMDRGIVYIKSASIRLCLYVLSDTSATFEVQFMKKLSNIEAELKKSVAYTKSVYLLNVLN